MSDEINAVEPQTMGPTGSEKPSVDLETLASDLQKLQQENARLLAELEKTRREAADRRVKARESSDKAATLEERLLKIEQEREKERLETQKTQIHNLRLTAITKFGLSPDDLEFLTGETSEAIEGQAKKLAERIKTTSPRPSVGAGSSQTPRIPSWAKHRSGAFEGGGVVWTNGEDKK